MCGWHSDSHPQLGRNPPVASVSLGAVRVFELRKKKVKICRFFVQSFSDPDPYWIRIQSGQWVRIRIRNPDLGGQK